MAEGDRPLEWAMAGRPIPGEDVSGDRGLVERCGPDFLLAAIDGLGHGPEAARAAEAAEKTLRENAVEPLDALLLLCHQAMAGTRGAAVTLVRVQPEAGELTWAGVGNVDAALVRVLPEGTRAVDTPLLHGGVVGYQLPVVSPRTVELRQGDLVILATDGVARGYAEGLRLGGELATLVADIVQRCAKGTDDALVVAARYRGGATREP
jgi:negative regulator of sigma-B (phosphoserine phosphatase)